MILETQIVVALPDANPLSFFLQFLFHSIHLMFNILKCTIKMQYPIVAIEIQPSETADQ